MDQQPAVGEPHWIESTTLGIAGRYDEEMDANARPDSPEDQLYRHRRHAHTGEPMDDWKPGPAPR